MSEEVKKTEPVQQLSPGKIVQSRYQIVRPVKSGGMGAVYEVFDQRLQKKWALKEMIESFSNEQDRIEATERFQREATLLASLDHPNLPRVIDYFEDLGKFYLVMDFIVGTDLNEMVRKYPGNRLPEGMVKNIAIDILSILDYLHNRKEPIIYRDIKPANIMIRVADNSTILIDFGIARSLSVEASAPKTEIGTVGYAPPEQYMGNPLPASDLYALAATMHELISGKHPRVPFQFKPLKELIPDVSKRTNYVITKALELNHKDRWKNAQEMMNELRGTEKSKPDLAEPDNSLAALPGLGGDFGALGTGALSLASHLQQSFANDSPATLSNLHSITGKARPIPEPSLKTQLFPIEMQQPPEPPKLDFYNMTPQEKNIMDKLYLYIQKFRSPDEILDQNEPIANIRFHPEREMILIAYKSGILQLKDLMSFNNIWSLNTSFPGVNAIDFSSEGSQIAYNSKTFECSVIDTKGHIAISQMSEQIGVISQIRFIPMEMELIIAYKDGTLMSYNYVLQKLSPIIYENPNPITHMEITSTGQHFITVHENGTINLWAAGVKRIITSAQQNTAITSLAIAPNNKLFASGGENGTITLWNLKTMQIVKNMISGEPARVTSLSYPVDKPYICSSSSGRIFIWDLFSQLYIVVEEETKAFFSKAAIGSYKNAVHFAGVSGSKLYIWKRI